jgi:hypothetical protein
MTMLIAMSVILLAGMGLAYRVGVDTGRAKEREEARREARRRGEDMEHIVRQYLDCVHGTAVRN